SRRNDAGDVRSVRGSRNSVHAAVWTFVTCGRGPAGAPAGAPGAITTAGLWTGSAVRHGLVRHRLPGAVAAGAVAVSGVPGFGRDGRHDPVLERRLLGGF